MQHPKAKRTPAGRYDLVMLVERDGLSFGQAAEQAHVSKSTVWEWTSRWRAASPNDRDGLVCLRDRSSRPNTSPACTARSVEDHVVLVRQLTGHGPRLVAGRTGVSHSTVHRILQRAGLSRPPRPPRAEVVRYEWPCPGDLLHMDTKRYARFERPGHAVTGDRGVRSPGAGYQFAHAIVDDHSRLAYVELHDDEKAQTVTRFVEHALAWFARHGVTAHRLMTDNAWSYTHNTSLAALLADNQIRHLTTAPRRPQTNGKVERFHQTMAREWGYGMTYLTHRHRALALPYWLDYYNERRPHSALDGRSPISRVRNLPGHDT